MPHPYPAAPNYLAPCAASGNVCEHYAPDPGSSAPTRCMHCGHTEQSASEALAALPRTGPTKAPSVLTGQIDVATVERAMASVGVALDGSDMPAPAPSTDAQDAAEPAQYPAGQEGSIDDPNLTRMQARAMSGQARYYATQAQRFVTIGPNGAVFVQKKWPDMAAALWSAYGAAETETPPHAPPIADLDAAKTVLLADASAHKLYRVFRPDGKMTTCWNVEALYGLALELRAPSAGGEFVLTHPNGGTFHAKKPAEVVTHLISAFGENGAPVPKDAPLDVQVASSVLSYYAEKNGQHYALFADGKTYGGTLAGLLETVRGMADATQATVDAFKLASQHAQNNAVFNVFTPDADVLTLKGARTVIERLREIYKIPAWTVEVETADAITLRDAVESRKYKVFTPDGERLYFDSAAMLFAYMHANYSTPFVVDPPAPPPAFVGATPAATLACRALAQFAQANGVHFVFKPNGDFHVTETVEDAAAELGANIDGAPPSPAERTFTASEVRNAFEAMTAELHAALHDIGSWAGEYQDNAEQNGLRFAQSNSAEDRCDALRELGGASASRAARERLHNAVRAIEKISAQAR